MIYVMLYESCQHNKFFYIKNILYTIIFIIINYVVVACRLLHLSLWKPSLEAQQEMTLVSLKIDQLLNWSIDNTLVYMPGKYSN